MKSYSYMRCTLCGSNRRPCFCTEDDVLGWLEDQEHKDREAFATKYGPIPQQEDPLTERLSPFVRGLDEEAMHGD